jgi:hypothetical protein
MFEPFPLTVFIAEKESNAIVSALFQVRGALFSQFSRMEELNQPGSQLLLLATGSKESPHRDLQ